MDNAELGRRLKAARLAKKMTQSDVVGNFITRNMLSQIESGTAMPSMKTLEYLADVLEIPMEKLLSGNDSSDRNPDCIGILQDAKRLLSEGKFEALLNVEDPTGILADELHALRSIAHLHLAQELAASRNTEQLQAAVMHARKSAEEAERGIYANAERAAQARMLISETAQYLSRYYSSLAQSGI
jgi:transcriptional regulator with XRE-family HTH domain